MFINDNFLLHNVLACKLYNEYSKEKKIIDYHCHLDPKMIAEDKIFNDITEMWLLGDHYKWRAMRANGVDEKYITGDASNKEKFIAWASVLENCIGNPLYHWSTLELKRYFDIDDLLTLENAEEIWEKTNEIIKSRQYSPRKLIEMSNVEYICTTDGLLDNLYWHSEISRSGFETKVVPGFRPDDIFSFGTDKFLSFIKKVNKFLGKSIENYEDFKIFIYDRIEYFSKNGCNVSDHGLGYIYFEKYTDIEVDKIFEKALKGEKIVVLEYIKFVSRIFTDLGKKYKEKGWLMQIHFGAIRNNDEFIFNNYGPDAGCDSMLDQSDLAPNLNALISNMKLNDALPRLVLYNLEPSSNHLVANTIHNFTSGLKRGWLQFGSGWWFNDTKIGMLRQLESLSDQGLLMNFIGMLTDSRSFLSYIRHEYFRRILCQYISELVLNGEIPNDERLLKRLIENISYLNAKEYLGIGE